MKQKDAFLSAEGDAWFARNVSGRDVRGIDESDPVLVEVLKLTSPAPGPGVSVLEIGCGDGARLVWLKEHRGCNCHGIDPSARAIDVAIQHGVAGQRGTAEHLPFADGMFDIVVFGFCLYLCDREDLFRVACEADRVLKNPGWLVILDFYSPAPLERAYRHRAGIHSYKMDYRSLFTWHPAYTTFSHKVQHHSEGGYTDDSGEWVATSVLRKSSGLS